MSLQDLEATLSHLLDHISGDAFWLTTTVDARD